MCGPREMGTRALGGALGAPSGVSWRLSRGCEVGSVLGTLVSDKVQCVSGREVVERRLIPKILGDRWPE